MDDKELERILSSEEPLVPSSGFALSVMEAIREAEAEPRHARLPWWRLAAGMAGCVGCAASFTAFVSDLDPAVASPLAAAAPELSLAAAVVLATLAWLRARRVFRASD
jgi:drug/metabolite transporter (DMT)-like permease